MNTLMFSIAAQRRPGALSCNQSWTVYCAAKALLVYPNSPSLGKVPLILTGHADQVLSCRFLSENLLISTSADKTARIYQLGQQQKWKCINVLAMPDNAITMACGVGISNQRLLIVTTTDDGFVCIWLIEKPNLPKLLWQKKYTKFIMAMDIHALPGDGNFILALGGVDSLITLMLLRPAEEAVEAKIREVGKLKGHTDWIRCLHFIKGAHDDEVLLASASQDKYIRCWTLSPHHPTNTKPLLNFELIDQRTIWAWLDSVLQAHDDWVYSARWASSTELISASADRTVIYWSKAELWLPKVRLGEIGGSTTFGFYDGAMISSGGVSTILALGYHGAIHVWQPIDKEQGRWKSLPTLGGGGHFGPVQQVQWDSKTGSFLFSVALDQTCRLFGATLEGEWREMARPQVHGYDLKCLSVWDPLRVCTGADEKMVRVFDAPRGFIDSLKQWQTTPVQEWYKSARDGRQVPMAAHLPPLGLSNKAVFEDTPSSSNLEREIPPLEESLQQNTLWPEVEKLYGHGNELCALARIKNYLASTCRATEASQAVIRFHDGENEWKQKQQPLAGHQLTVVRLVAHGDHLLSVSRDRSWMLSRLSQDEFIIIKHQLKAHARIIWDAAWTPCGAYFVTASRDKTLKLWSVQQLELITTITFNAACTSCDLASQLFEERAWILAVGLENGEIVIVSIPCQDPTKWTIITSFAAHMDAVVSIAWRPQQWMLASGSTDCSVRITQFNANFVVGVTASVIGDDDM